MSWKSIILKYCSIQVVFSLFFLVECGWRVLMCPKPLVLMQQMVKLEECWQFFPTWSNQVKNHCYKPRQSKPQFNQNNPTFSATKVVFSGKPSVPDCVALLISSTNKFDFRVSMSVCWWVFETHKTYIAIKFCRDIHGSLKTKPTGLPLVIPWLFLLCHH